MLNLLPFSVPARAWSPPYQLSRLLPLVISLSPLHSTPPPSLAPIDELYIPLIRLLSSRYLLIRRVTIVTLAAHLRNHPPKDTAKEYAFRRASLPNLFNRSSSICLFRARISGLPWIKRTKKVSVLVLCKWEPIRLSGEFGAGRVKQWARGGRKRAVRRGFKERVRRLEVSLIDLVVCLWALDE